MADARKIIETGNKQQGKKIMATLERKKKLQTNTDKKLAKDVCLWVQSSTSATAMTDLTDVSEKISTSRSNKSNNFISNNIRKNGATVTGKAIGDGATQNKTSLFLRWLSHMRLTVLTLFGLCSTFILPLVATIIISHYLLRKSDDSNE